MFGLPKFGDGIGLSRIERFYESHRIGSVGMIQTHTLSQRSLVVTGSNGKGSTARFAAGLLEAAGKRVGLFTSPHMFDVTERFVIGDKRISRETLDRHAATVLAYNERLPQGDRMGAFEALFLIAVLWFEEEAPDAIVWEAGIGGRYDPVRTLRARVSALTSLELEHTQLLGATEELIAYDKIDALAPRGILVVSPSVPDSFRRRIAHYCALEDRKPLFVNDCFNLEKVSGNADGVDFVMHFPWSPPVRTQVHIALPGRHQIDNAVTALGLVNAYRSGHLDMEPPGKAELAALAGARWPGRLERVATNPDLWIDVGHTPKALDLVTSAFLDFIPREKTLVIFGVSASKDVAAIAATVAQRFDHVILTRAHKAGADIASFANAFAGKQVTIEPDISQATRLARERAAKEGMIVLAVGGLFLAAEIQHAWEGGNPAELEFL